MSDQPSRTALHTPTPWFINTASGATQIAAEEPFHDIGVCYTSGSGNDHRVAIANAEFIVTAVNSHASLVEALKDAERWLEGWASAEPYLSRVRAALLKTTGSKASECGEQT